MVCCEEFELDVVAWGGGNIGWGILEAVFADLDDVGDWSTIRVGFNGFSSGVYRGR